MTYATGTLVECHQLVLKAEQLSKYPKVAAWRTTAKEGRIVSHYTSKLWLVSHTYDVDRVAVYHEDELRLARSALIQKFKYTAEAVSDEEVQRLLGFYKQLVPLLADMGPHLVLAHRDAASDLHRLTEWCKYRARS